MSSGILNDILRNIHFYYILIKNMIIFLKLLYIQAL
nr:MAG TPA: hypothetical protein [Caudoviricetes sp.]